MNLKPLTLTNVYKNKNQLMNLHKKNIIIDKIIINKYNFLSSYINYKSLFFEDSYFSIFYILEEDVENNKENIIIYNFIIDKLNKSYCKNSMSYYDFKNAILNINFSLLKKSFIFSNLHLSGYEYDFNNDINEFLNKVIYIDIIYSYTYASKIIKIDFDYYF
jgi:hypothetical protein